MAGYLALGSLVALVIAWKLPAGHGTAVGDADRGPVRTGTNPAGR